MINDLEPTRQQKCAELARAMGFYIQSISERFKIWRLFDSKGNTVSECGVSSEAEAWGDAPNPFTDHESCHALMLWLAEQRRNGSGKANWIIFVKTIIPESKYLPTVYDIAEAFLTADLAIRAEAAWQSIQKEIE